jgi:hypothetical protein
MGKNVLDDAILGWCLRFLLFVSTPAGFVAGVIWYIAYITWYDDISSILGVDADSFKN